MCVHGFARHYSFSQDGIEIRVIVSKGKWCVAACLLRLNVCVAGADRRTMATSRVNSFGKLPDLADDPQLVTFPEIKMAQVSDLPVRALVLGNWPCVRLPLFYWFLLAFVASHETCFHARHLHHDHKVTSYNRAPPGQSSYVIGTRNSLPNVPPT